MSVAEREVAAICAANTAAQPGEVLVVAALPGTGKTTLLQKLAKESTEPTVYLMFNRTPCEEFRSWLVAHELEHVSAYTFHKLAFDCVNESGALLNAVESPPARINALVELHGLSSVSNLLETHPSVAREWYDKAVLGEWSVTTDVVLHWLAHASVMPELQSTPTFLRLRQARRLYVDEAQDCSSAMVKIIKGCTAASVVIAGDTNQGINGFMGAVDPVGNRALHFPGAPSYPLSQTWRFHSQIADAFNTVTRERCIGRPGRPDAGSAPAGSTIVLCPTNKAVDAALDELKRRKIKAFKRGEAGNGGVEVSTVHKAKGGGWHTVVVMALRRRGDTKLVATAVSRARERLYVHYSLVKEWKIKTTSHVKRFGDLDEIHF